MKKLTNKQQKIYNYLVRYIDHEGYPPTVREVGEAFEITAKAAYDHLRALEKKGIITTGRGRSRAISIVKRDDDSVLQIPLLGQIAAGMPIATTENIEENLTFPRNMFSDSGPFFALRVQGNSMKDAGICNDDIAILRQQSTAECGDIVAALIGDESTLKYFLKKDNKIVLRAAHEDYSDIYPDIDSFSIVGKVAGVYKNF